MNNIRLRISSLREYLTPITHTSTFKETGEITPEEFVAAGDYLVYKFPTWLWLAAPKASLAKLFLPPDKQFLVTRKVPSYERAMTYLSAGDLEEVEEDGWTTTHIKKSQETPIEVKKEPESEPVAEIQDIDDDDFDVTDTQNTSKRSYDLYILYSTLYRVPKMYLIGFDSDGVPLTPAQMFEDIASDYRDKTATIEKAPFLVDTTSVSIHPCRHATVMRVLISRAQLAAQNRHDQEITKGIEKLGLKDADEEEDEDWENVDGGEVEVVRVDQYLVIFLKFIASVTPGITHDYTMDAF